MSQFLGLEDFFHDISQKTIYYLRGRGASKEDAEDIVQNTLIKLMPLVTELKREQLIPWFYRVAFNEWIDLKRREKRGRELVESTPKSQTSVPVSMENKLETQEELLASLTSIKKEYREILLLKYYFDLNYAEIAELLIATEGNVKVMLYRARKAVKKTNKGVNWDG